MPCSLTFLVRCVFDLVCRFDVSSCFQARERERADREAMERPGDVFLILREREGTIFKTLRHTFTMKTCLRMFA